MQPALSSPPMWHAVRRHQEEQVDAHLGGLRVDQRGSAGQPEVDGLDQHPAV